MAAEILYSASVAAGGLNESPVLDLWGKDAIEVVVDNTLGTAYRDLTMTTYLDDGTTVVDVLKLRAVPFGAAAAGQQYDPGRVRAYVGPHPAVADSLKYLLYDATSAPNAALSSPIFPCDDVDAIFGWSKGAGGTHTLLGVALDDAGVGLSVWGASTAGADNTAAYPATDAANVGAGNWRIDHYAPKRARFDTTAGGVGISVRMVLFARGRLPGTFSHQMVLPRRVKLSLAAAGTGAARLTVLG